MGTTIRAIRAASILWLAVTANDIAHAQTQSAGIGCPDSRDVEVSGQRELKNDADRGIVQDALRRQLLLESVRQAVGVVIRSRTELSFEQFNDRVDEGLRERIFEKVSGRVDSYRVVAEDVVVSETGEGRSLVMTVAATVCVPDPSEIPDIVAVGTIQDANGAPSEWARDTVLGAIPDERLLVITPLAPSDGYYDVTIMGRVAAVAEAEIDNSEQKRLIQQFVRSTVTSRVPTRAKQLEVSVALYAEAAGGEALLTETATLRRLVSVDAPTEGLRRQLIERAFVEATGRLIDRLVAAR